MRFKSCLPLAAISFFSYPALCQIRVETSCYLSRGRHAPSQTVSLTLQTYFDEKLGREIGAFVRYDKNRHVIPLALIKKVSTDISNPELGNFESKWIEIIDGKIGGQYSLIQCGAGIKQGRSVLYVPPHSNKPTSFQKFGDGEECDK